MWSQEFAHATSVIRLTLVRRGAGFVIKGVTTCRRMHFYSPSHYPLPANVPATSANSEPRRQSLALISPSMQANDGENDTESEHLSGAQERPQRGVRGAGLPPVINDATVHELNQIKTEALMDINEGGFSCVTSLSLPSACGLLIVP